MTTIQFSEYSSGKANIYERIKCGEEHPYKIKELFPDGPVPEVSLDLTLNNDPGYDDPRPKHIALQLDVRNLEHDGRILSASVEIYLSFEDARRFHQMLGLCLEIGHLPVLE